MLSFLIWWLPFPNWEGEFLLIFTHRANSCEPDLLDSDTMMSTCSLLSSLTMTAVFRASCTPCRWHVRPGIIALPFQVFSRRPVCFTFLSILFELVQTYRSGLHPNPKHPCSEVSEPWRDITLLAGGGRGGRRWGTQLRAAELKARGSCQWNVTVSPTIEGSPCCLTLRQLSWRLITHRLLFSVLFRPRSASSRVLSNTQSLGWVVLWRVSCYPSNSSPL